VGVSPARVDSEVVLLILRRLGGGSDGWNANLANTFDGTDAILHQICNDRWTWVRLSKVRVGCDGKETSLVEAAISETDMDERGATACCLLTSVGF